MSGIAGIIHFDGRPVEPGLIEKMTSAMAHRGPDGINHWVKGSVALGQCMLRTTPESLEETQPLTNEDESLVLPATMPWLWCAKQLSDIPLNKMKASNMNLSDKVFIPTQVMARTVGDETVILDLASGIYYGLDPVGARMWQLMADGQTLAAVCDTLLAEYEVTREALEGDILRLTEELRAKGLVLAS